MSDELDAQADAAPLLEGVLFEEGSGDNDDAAGLELDAQQSKEIRQIFLTTLPDYLAPIEEMVEKLAVETDAGGEVRGALAKTIASIAEAASRVGLDDVARSMEALREDVVLLGDAGEPQEPLAERVRAALASLGELAQKGSAGVPGGRGEVRSETLVSAFRAIEAVDASALQKLVSAGVVYVDQLIDADPKEVALVSGLDAAVVLAMTRALRASRGAEAPVHAARAHSTPPSSSAPQDEPRATGTASETCAPSPVVEESLPSRERSADDVGTALRGLVDEELALDELRGETLRLRIGIQALRGEIDAIGPQCETLRGALADARARAAEALTELAELEARKAALSRDLAATAVELEKVGCRLTALEAERRGAIAEVGRLADDTAALAERVTRGLDARGRS